VNPLPNVAISVVGAGTGTGGTFVAGGPITFNIIASPGQNSTAQIRNVTVEFGDGDRRDLGAVTTTGTTPLPVQHIYNGPGTFTARVIVTDNFGFQSSSATIVVVQAQPPLSVTINQQRTVAGSNTVFNLTATVAPASAVPSSFSWEYRAASNGALITASTTTSGQDTQTFPNTQGPVIVRVTVQTTTPVGGSAVGTTTIVPSGP
jgi:hypothetical protein